MVADEWKRPTSASTTAVLRNVSAISPITGRTATLASRLAGFIGCPLVRNALLMRGFTTLAGNLTLPARVHRCESTTFLVHDPASVRAGGCMVGANNCLTVSEDHACQGVP
jgi:hypothetical protein